MKKLHAYSDADGFIHFNVIKDGKKGLWSPSRKEYVYREEDLDISVNMSPEWFTTILVLIGYLICVAILFFK